MNEKSTTTPSGAQLAAQGMANQDPLDMPLPCDIRVHGMCFSKGVKLRVFIEAAASWKVLADKHVAGDLKPNPNFPFGGGETL